MWMGKSRYSWFSYSSSSLEGTGKFSSVSCLSLAPLPSGDRTGFGSIQEQRNLPSLSSFRVAPLTVLHISSANLVSESFNSIIFLMAWSSLWALTRLSWLMVSRWEWPGGCLGKKCCAWPTKPHLSVPLPDSHPMYCSLPHLRTPLCKLSHVCISNGRWDRVSVSTFYFPGLYLMWNRKFESSPTHQWPTVLSFAVLLT